ncbi:MAG: PilN domain-containing protein [Terriglobales bacterium]
MRIEINLATQPYQDVRRLLIGWGSAVVALAVLTAVLLYATVTQLAAWHAVRRDIAERRAQIAEQDKKRAAVEAFLNRPENRDTRDRGRFLNQLIARKEFSWTRAFSDLERLVPNGLHVVALRPGLTPNNELELRMSVATGSRDSAIELVRRLEQSPHFTRAQVLSESLTAGGSGNPESVAFEISAIYIPSFAQEVASGRR